MSKGLYLTIDDSPSASFEEKLSFLISREVPAVFFCEGARMEGRLPVICSAITSGYAIGNHAYSHRPFSTLSVQECIEEIDRTGRLIDEVYQACGVSHYPRLFRFPYGDKGNYRFGSHFFPFSEAYLKGVRSSSRLKYEALRLLPGQLARPYFDKWQKLGAERHLRVQEHLISNGYQSPAFPIDHPLYQPFRQDKDWMWTFDVEEYTYRHQPDAVSFFDKICRRLEADQATNAYGSHGTPAGLFSMPYHDILLMHDHTETDGLFYKTIDYLLQKGVRFLNPLSDR